jgi:hypothetical protein
MRTSVCVAMLIVAINGGCVSDEPTCHHEYGLTPYRQYYSSEYSRFREQGNSRFFSVSPQRQYKQHEEPEEELVVTDYTTTTDMPIAYAIDPSIPRLEIVNTLPGPLSLYYDESKRELAPGERFQFILVKHTAEGKGLYSLSRSAGYLRADFELHLLNLYTGDLKIFMQERNVGMSDFPRLAERVNALTR